LKQQGVRAVLEQLLQKDVVITLAVCGACIVTMGHWLQLESRAVLLGKILFFGGYGISGASVLLFILAGLLGSPG
jgi:hypothetical protein